MTDKETEDDHLHNTISIASPLKMSQKTTGMSFKRQKHPYNISNNHNRGGNISAMKYGEGAAAFRYSF